MQKISAQKKSARHDERLILSLQLGEVLQAKNQQICVAESCTGGGLAAAITAVAGSSAWFECGFVAYSNAIKTRLLGVPPTIFSTVGAVSAECVAAMSAGALAACEAHYAVAISGIAGPGGGTPTKPVGTVWIAWRYRADKGMPVTDSRLNIQQFLFTGDRQAVRRQAVVAALRGVLDQ